MKRHFLFLVLFIFIGYGCSDDLDYLPENTSEGMVNNPSAMYYYYAQGEKYPIELNTNYAFVSALNEDGIAPIKLLRNYNVGATRTDGAFSTPTRSSIAGRKWVELEFLEQITPDQYRAYLDNLREMDKNIIVSPYFKTPQNKPIGLSNYFYVKLKEGRDSLLLKTFAEETMTQVIGPNQYLPLWYVLSVTPQTQKNSLEMANYFHESELFQYAEPDFMEDALIARTMNDPYISRQWAVDQNLTQAWDLSTGQGIKIAIVDAGILSTHEDLIISSDSYDSESNTSPSQLLGDHGTLCAGMAAAKGNNGKGIVGVAPDAQIIDISNSMRNTPLSQMKRADGIMKAVSYGADVISNSWRSSTVHSVINEAIDYAVTRGRNGKGCVVVFSSGNDYASTVCYPSRLPNVLSVGATDNTNRRTGFSNYGYDLDVVAPGVSIYSTSAYGGYEYVDGTSFSCPYVAGVAALILSKNPSFKESWVRTIIKNTTTKVPGYSFSTSGSDYSLYKNLEIGHGLVNPKEAVQASISYGRLSNIQVYPADFGDLNVIVDNLICENLNSGANLDYGYDGFIMPDIPQTIRPLSPTSYCIENVYVEIHSENARFRLSGYSWNLNGDIMRSSASNMDPVNVNFTATNTSNPYKTLYRMTVTLKSRVLKEGDQIYNMVIEEPHDTGIVTQLRSFD